MKLTVNASRGETFFFFARAASTMGDNMYAVALVFAALSVGGGGAVGFVLAAEMLPKLLLSAAAGALADRLQPTRVLIVADLVAGLVAVSMAAMLASGNDSVVMLIVVSALLGAATSFFDPAALKLISSGFAQDRRKAINANVGVASSISRIAGASLAGLLITSIGTAFVVLLNGTSFLLSAFLLIPVARATARRSAESTPAAFTGTKCAPRSPGSFREYFRAGWLWRLGVQGNVVLLFGVGLLNVAGPVYADQALGGATAWGIVQACNGVGFFAGRMTARRCHFVYPARAAALCLFAVALPVLVVGANGGLLLLAGAQLASGCGLAMRSTLWGGLIATAIDGSAIGRVVSVEQIIGLLTTSVSLALVGGLVSSLGLRAMPLTGFVAITVVTIIVSLAPALRVVAEPRVAKGVSS